MSYEAEVISGLRLSGWPLRAVARLSESALLGGLVGREMFRQVGLDRFASFECSEAPTVAPVLPRRGDLDAPPARPCDADQLSAIDSLEARPCFGESVADFQSAYREGRLDPVSVVEAWLERYAESEARRPPLRALIAQSAEDLRAQARASADRLRRGAPLGPLEGVPVAVKDEVEAIGYGTTLGTSFLGGRLASRDASAVARLRGAGALIVGKANMHEVGLGVTGINPHHGSARNPYDLERITGGSSSGSAAAVAAGLCPISLGADGGGSIRIPASLCGVFGLKPTFGRVSEDGAAPLCWSLAHLGPLGLTAKDLALGYGIMAGPCTRDPLSVGQPPIELPDSERARSVEGLRVGVVPGWFEHADPEVVAACEAMLGALVSRGARKVHVDIESLDRVRLVHLVTIATEMASSRRRLDASSRRSYGCDVRLNLALARRLSGMDYVLAQRLRRRICDRFAATFDRVDVLLSPATGCTAPPLRSGAERCGESNPPEMDRIMRFAQAANLTGLPALSMPIGHDKAGLPIGMQLMGPAWSEARLLELAWWAEGLVERRAPPGYRGLLQA